jgi:rhodanese-related sulfurtransferase
MKLSQVFFALIFSVAFISSCQSQTSGEGTTKNVDVVAFSETLEGGSDYILLDVRTPAEVAEGVIEGAVVIDFFDADFAKKVAELEKDKPVLVYCRSGARSGKAMKVMQEAGFSDVTNLSGGILAWMRSGKPVVKL